MSKRKNKLAEKVFRGFANFMKYEKELKRRMDPLTYHLTHDSWGLMPGPPGLTKKETKEPYHASDYYQKEWKESCVSSRYGMHLDLFKEE